MTTGLAWLPWQKTLDQRLAEARLCLFYKIVYGLVAVPPPDYEQPVSINLRRRDSMAFR